MRYGIRASRHTGRISIAGPGDFSLGQGAGIAPDSLRKLAPLPYCLDFARRRAIYVGGVNSRDAQQAPFYYLHLRRNAQFILSVPWEHGSLFSEERRSPIFLFSPGRCGSTLLGRIMFEAGIANVSEPDFYTQATTQFFASAINPLRALMKTTLRSMGRDLCSVLASSGPVVAKLRAESNRAPGLLIAPAERRTLYMTREFESWARSNVRTFRNGPAKTVRKYLSALAGYDYLRQNSDCLLLRYEDLMRDAAAFGRRLGAFLNTDIPVETIASAMKKDSQEGTPLAQGVRAGPPNWEQRLEKTLLLWNSDKVKRMRGRFDAVNYS